MLLKFMLLILVSFSISAGELYVKKIVAEKESINFCQDKQAALNNEQLARKTPNDEKLIKLVALRAGLCDVI